MGRVEPVGREIKSQLMGGLGNGAKELDFDSKENLELGQS